jgi:Geranylgeranyl pyrophosphate synthase
MNFQDIVVLIEDELCIIEKEIKDIGSKLTMSSTQEIFNYFFSSKGKYLRPTLILLSAKAINPDLSTKQLRKLIDLSVAIELIHSASLIHDDIIDGDLMRRGQKTLNNIYGRKIAVLAGDALFAKAFTILSTSLPRKSECIITEVIQMMCVAEIDQAKDEEITQQKYLEIIEGKTAIFMSICCRLGAELAGADKEDITVMERYGLEFGLVYQIIDDCLDGDLNAEKNITLDDAEHHANNAKTLINHLKESKYKKGLIDLLNYILSFSHCEVKN